MQFAAELAMMIIVYNNVGGLAMIKKKKENTECYR